MAGVKMASHYVRLSRMLQADLWIWDMLLESYNDHSLWLAGPVSNADLVLFTDAAGSVGYSAYFQGQ